MLTFIPPLLPTMTDVPPDGDDWIHEIKQDGYRTILAMAGGDARAFTRQGNDWTSSYRQIVEAALKLRCNSATIDGEVIVQDEEGRSDFSALQRDIHRSPDRLVLIAFDLLELNGKDLRRRPIEERRGLLMDLVGEPSKKIAFSDAVVGNGQALFDVAVRMELEGVVSKKLGSAYVSGRSRSWLKSKAFVVDTYDVIGVTRTPGEAPSALLSDKGIYVGRAFINLPADLKDAFWAYIDSHPANGNSHAAADGRDVKWVQPGLQAEVKHLQGPGKLRHASLRNLSLAPR